MFLFRFRLCGHSEANAGVVAQSSAMTDRGIGRAPLFSPRISLILLRPRCLCIVVTLS